MGVTAALTPYAAPEAVPSGLKLVAVQLSVMQLGHCCGSSILLVKMLTEAMTRCLFLFPLNHRRSVHIIFVTPSSSTCTNTVSTESGNRIMDVPYLHILKAILLTDATKHILLTALLHLASEQKLIQYEICLLKVEYYVQLANIAIVFVHLFNITMNNLQCDQLVIGRVAPGDEEERSVATIDDFGICVRQSSACMNTMQLC